MWLTRPPSGGLPKALLHNYNITRWMTTTR